MVASELRHHPPTHNQKPFLGLFERKTKMKGGGCSNVEWTIDEKTREITMSFVSSPNADWIGIGISENGGMKGADMAIVRKEAKNKENFKVIDAVSFDFTEPAPDRVQNIELLSANTLADGRIHAVIRRGIETCDREDIKIEPFKQHIICASGNIGSNGQLLYHGPKRHATSFVNLFVDEDLLFDRKSQVPVNSTRNELSSRVRMFGNPAEATSRMAVDFTMPKISIDSNIKTTYLCTALELPFDIRVTEFDPVWGDGLSSTKEEQPDYLHHQILYYCDEGSIDPSFLDGKAFDCLDEMPACDPVIGVAKGTKLSAPSGIHFPLEKGHYIMTVHYENTIGELIQNDQSGVRLWIEPPSIQSSTTPGQTTAIRAQHNTIHIPADPKQKEYDLQYQISSEATRAVLPPSGVQVFGSMYHMHNHGVRSRLQLIRNGTHIDDIFDSISYDYNIQAPTWKRWKLLPGDALIMTCTYRPHPNRDLIGGFSSNEEMCMLGLAFAPRIPSMPSFGGVGYAVRPNEPFRNSFLGSVADEGRVEYLLDYSQAIYPPNPEGRKFESILDHQEDFCGVLLHKKLSLSYITIATPNVSAQIAIACAFFFCFFCTRKWIWPKIAAMQSEKLRRSTIVYLGHLLFSTFSLPVALSALAELIPATSTVDAVDPETYIFLRFLIYTQSVLFLVELLYRIDVRLEVVLHHLCTAAIILFLTMIMDRSYAVRLMLRVGTVLILMAFLDHPLNLTLLLKNLGYAETTTWWTKLCRASAFLFIVLKIAAFIIGIKIMADGQTGADVSWVVSTENFSKWHENSGIMNEVTTFWILMIILIVLLIVQLHAAIVLWKLADRYDAKLAEQQKIHTVSLEEMEKSIEDDTPQTESEDSA